MKTLMIAGAVMVAALLLGSCETMSEDQCQAGDWGQQGYNDGASGQAMSRLDDHAKACAKYGVEPDMTAYQSARNSGLELYCTEAKGFAEGHEGNSYRGVCPASLERDFLPAYGDGQIVHEAESALSSAVSSVSGYASRLAELDDKIESKRRESRDETIPEADRNRARDRVGELRREREDTERNWRGAQRDADEADRRARDVRYRFQRTYGSW